MIPKSFVFGALILSGVGGLNAYAALNQSVDFTTQDSGYTLTGDGGAGVYGVGGAGGLVAVTSTPSSFLVAPTGFTGNYFAIERPNNVNSTVYSFLSPANGTTSTTAAAYLTLPTVNGTMTNGSVSFSFKYAAPNAGTARYDGLTGTPPPSRTVMEYSLNGGSTWQTAIAIQGRGNGNTGDTVSSNTGMWWDSNNDGLFDGTDFQITSAATPVSRTISGITVTSSFTARIRIESGTQEEMVVDDISVTSAQFTAIPEPATYGVAGAGALAGLALVRRRRKAA